MKIIYTLYPIYTLVIPSKTYTPYRFYAVGIVGINKNKTIQFFCFSLPLFSHFSEKYLLNSIPNHQKFAEKYFSLYLYTEMRKPIRYRGNLWYKVGINTV